MTTFASRAARIVVLVATALSSPQFASPVLASDELEQVRPMGRRVEALVTKGVMRSRTMRCWSSELSRTDVVVYVRSTPRRPSDLAGSIGFMGVGADGRRWLMVTLYGDEGWTTLEDAEDRQLITLGHELRHVLEVAADPRASRPPRRSSPSTGPSATSGQKDRVDTTMRAWRGDRSHRNSRSSPRVTQWHVPKSMTIGARWAAISGKLNRRHGPFATDRA